VQQLGHRRLAGEVQRTRRAKPRAHVLRVGLLAGNARDHHEHVGILQQIPSELGERFERQASHGKPGAGVWIENHELAGRSDVGMDRAELPPDFGRPRSRRSSPSMFDRVDGSYLGSPASRANSTALSWLSTAAYWLVRTAIGE
jgi:hypothetical protein